MIKNAFIWLLTAIVVVNTSCIKEQYIDTDNEDFHPQESTYANLSVRINYGAEADTVVKEYDVDNLSLLFFGANNKLEVNQFFGKSELVEGATGALPGKVWGSSYALKKAVMVTAGRKKVVALINTNESLRAELQTIKTYDAYKRIQVQTGNQLTGNANTNSYLKEMGISHGTSAGNTFTTHFNALLMSGEQEVTLEAGVTETDVEADQKNVIKDLRVERVMAKVTLAIKSLEGFNANFSYIESISRVILGNVPKSSFLMKQTNNASPFFDNATDFEPWDRDQNRVEHPTEFSTTNGGSKYTFYVPENTFATPYRGNTTFMGIGFRMSYKSTANFWCFYDEDKNKTHYVAAAPGSSPAHPWNGDSYKYIRSFFNETLTYIKEDTVDASPLIPDRIIVMDRYTRDKRTQDAALKNKLGATITPGWALFVYRTENLDNKFVTERWYDEMQLYYYTGKSEAGGDAIRTNRYDFKAAYYGSGNYFRLNLEDFQADVLSSKRYVVNRNDWFDITVKGIKAATDDRGFKFPGYPDIKDLTRSKGSNLYDSFLDVEIKIKNWEDGGSQDIPLE